MKRKFHNSCSIYSWFRKLAVIILFILSPLFVHYTYSAATTPPPVEDPSCWPPPCIPIDGGIVFLIAAGLAYGGKKAFDLYKNKKSAS